MPWWPHLHYYWVKGYFCYPSKNLPIIFADSKQAKTPFWRNSVTYGTPCHAIGHFVFYYHHVTYRTPCHASGHLVIYRECSGFERAFSTLRRFFTLHSFLLVSRPPWGRQFNLKVSRASCWSSKHSPGPTICLNHNNLQKGL